MDKIRLNKYIANSGVCSRRKAEEYIISGRISVNGKILTELGVQVTQDDIVCLDGKRLILEDEKIYIMLNKPKGYITTVKEQFNRKSVLDLVKISQRVYPVGRLDMDSEGLLLLTNDGNFSNNIIHPTKCILKRYEVILKEKISKNEVTLLENGVDIGGYLTKPAKVEVISNTKIIICISEGKNRQVRRMCEAIGNKVVNLKRISIGSLKLGNLRTGEYIKLTDDDLKKIFE